MKPEISNEQLSAFVDDELDIPEKDGLFSMLGSDPKLAQQVCELRTLKELVRHGYTQLPDMNSKSLWTKRFHAPQSLVAGVVLMLGLTLGWVGHDWSQPQPVTRLVHGISHPLDTGALRPVSLSGVTEDMHKIVLHVDSADPAKFKTLLDDVDFLTQHQAALGLPVQVEVVASSYGLNLLRTDVTPYAARVRALVDQHPNVVFVACNQTMQRLHKEGVNVKLLPHTRVAPTATEEVVNRLHSGWTYIKV